ncbi:MAG: hypothetical protein HW421_195 [Ignavibacteria bacterium]|nr:hypothetical protein [Ignavibacteria bacterium]
MKKNNKIKEIAPEYDFSKGIRGKHHKQFTEGYTVTVYSPNKNAIDKQTSDKANYFKIDKDVHKYFQSSEEINNALRAIISAIPKSGRKATPSL